MKNLLLSLAFVFAALTSFAQTSDHLTFKGVPIDGTLEEYIAQMKKNGFSYLGTDDGTALLKGDFAGYKNCYVGVTTLKQRNLVHKIGVIFPSRDTWSTLSGNYFDLKEMLTIKYGEPSNVLEIFESDFEPKDDMSRMHEVKFDRCKYYSIWETNKGEIQLSIDHVDTDKCFIKLAYFDKINSEKIREDAINDL